MASTIPNRLKKRQSILLSVLLILLLAGTTYGVVRHFSSKPVVSHPVAPLTKLPTPSTLKSNQQPATSTSQVNQGTSIDKQGKVPANSTIPPTNQWTTSESGAITVKYPGANTTVKPGGDVYGVATVDKVQYRLIDNTAGVISQGFINVVNGNFSAAITFKPYASTGRLDVYSLDANGREVNEVQVPVNF